MAEQAPYYWQASTLILNVYTQPKASKDEYSGLHGTHLKIRITATPKDGKANIHLLYFLADSFNVPFQATKLLRGEKSRFKIIQIENPNTLPDWIKRHNQIKCP